MTEANGEARLVKPLVEWLYRRRRARADTIILREFPWFRRRVDLVTLSCSGTASAFELKLRDNKRAVRQAAYNKLVFDRSYVVTASEPTEENLRRAHEASVGFILLTRDFARLLQESPASPVCNKLRRRLLRCIRGSVATNVWQ